MVVCYIQEIRFGRRVAGSSCPLVFAVVIDKGIPHDRKQPAFEVRIASELVFIL
jgi:hypothetical protein